MIHFYHMVKARNLNGIGDTIIFPQQLEALRDVPWIPWLHGANVVAFGIDENGLPTYTPKVDKIAQVIEDEWTGDVEPVADVAYLDIELARHRLWGPGRVTIYADAIYVVKQIMPSRYRKGLSIYSLVQSWWRLGEPPHFYQHATIDPFVDVHSISLYNYNRPATRDMAGLTAAVELDKRAVDRAFAHFDGRDGKPRMVWVWGWSKGGYFVPLELWKDYIRYIVKYLKPGDIIAWFGAAKREASDRDFARKIRWLTRFLPTVFPVQRAA